MRNVTLTAVCRLSLTSPFRREHRTFNQVFHKQTPARAAKCPRPRLPTELLQST
jgi:hypothetical protein